MGIQWPATPSTGIFSPAPNRSSGEYGPLLVSGNYLYAAQAGPFWKVYDITTGALVSSGLGPLWFGDAFTKIGNNAYEIFAVDGGVGELNASYGNRINGSFILAPATPTGDRGIAASGNGVGLSQEALFALPAADRMARIAAAEKSLLAAGADVVIDTVAQLMTALRSAT